MKNNYVDEEEEEFAKVMPVITFQITDGYVEDLVIYNKTQKQFELNSECAKQLFDEYNNIAFVFNIGEPDVGKSFLMNQILDLDPRNKAFEQNQPGMKIWMKPFYKQQDDVYIFFVDVIGMDRDDQFFQNFIWLFTLLTGSMVFYSSKGEINDHTLAQFEPLNYLVQNLIFSNEQNENIYSMSYYSPLFFWLLKDMDVNEIDQV